MRKRDLLFPSFQSTFPSSSSSSSSSGQEEDMPSNLSDTVFWFLDENYPSSGSGSDLFSDTSSDRLLENEEEQLLDGEESNRPGETTTATKAFWEQQEQLLLSTLRRTSSTESKIRQATKQAVREYSSSSSSSSDPSSQSCCHHHHGQDSPINGTTTISSSCRTCFLIKHVHQRLVDAGHSCSVRKSKWKSSQDIPSGEHTYLEVVVQQQQQQHVPPTPTKVIIELNFRAEFEMARAGEEYHTRLVSHLPEVFVGKPERLRILVKILCGAAKKCVKDKGSHLGPWRKHKYMQSKWRLLTTTTNTTTEDHNEIIVSMMKPTMKKKKSSTSMLTFALLDHNNNTNNNNTTTCNLHRRQLAVAVV